MGGEENMEIKWNDFKNKITEAGDEVLCKKKIHCGEVKMTPW